MRREWAERNVKAHLAAWDRAAAAASRRAIEQRREPAGGLATGAGEGAGRRPGRPHPALDRPRAGAAGRPGGRRPDRAGPRSAAAGRGPRTEPSACGGQPAAPPGVARRSPRARGHDCGRVDGRRGVARFHRRCESPCPARVPRSPAAARPESEAIWLARRAATEIALDTGLRFLRYQDMVIPDPGPGQPAPALSPAMALSEFKRLLNPDGAAGPARSRWPRSSNRSRTGGVSAPS